jgi:hypothetical protein
MVWKEYNLRERRAVLEMGSVFSSPNMYDLHCYLYSETALILTETNVIW